MKKSDLNRLKKVVKLYEKIEQILDTAYDSVDNDNTEYIVFSDDNKTRVSTTRIIGDMYKDAQDNRNWIQGKITMMEEQISNG